MSDERYLAELFKREGFYRLSGGGDGCLCAHFSVARVEFSVHCWKTSPKCGCRWAGIHITPRVDDGMSIDDLVAAGEVIRGEMDRPDMLIPIVIHEDSDASSYSGYVDPKPGEKREQVFLNEPVGSYRFTANGTESEASAPPDGE